MIVVRWLYESERGSRAPRVERFETAASARRWIRAAREAARRHPEEDAVRIIDSSPPLRDRTRTSRQGRRDPHAFTAYDEVARQYGYGVAADGVILKLDGSPSSLVVSTKGRRMYVRSTSGALMFSGGGPASLGSFLEKFWYAKKVARSDPKREREMRKALQSARGSFKDMAQRRANAEERFLEYAQERAGLTRSEAERALAAYRRAKAIKFDGGQFTFTHGGFADAVVLRRAAGIER